MAGILFRPLVAPFSVSIVLQIPGYLAIRWLLITLVAYVIATLLLLLILWRIYQREVVALRSRIEEKAQKALAALEEERQRLRQALQEAGLTADLPTEQPPDLEAMKVEPGTRETLASIISRIDGLEIAIPQAPPPTTLDLMQMGNTYFFLGQFEKAIEKYTEVVLKDSQSSKAYYNRGLAYSNLGQNEAAIQDFDKVIELDPTYTAAYYNRGLAHITLGLWQAAIDDFTELIELDPSDARAYYNLGLAYANLNLYEKALQNYQQAADLAPEDPKARYGLATAYALLGDAPAAIDALAWAIGLAPDYGHIALTDKAFDNIRDNPAFIALVGG